MKNTVKYLFLLLFGVTFCNAQYLVEDSEVVLDNEMGKSRIGFDLKNPLEFYRLKCDKPSYAQFPGGENEFKNQIFEGMMAYLDHSAYSVNGSFDFIFEINKEGSLKKFTLLPEVNNSDMLYRDLNFIVRRMKGNWQPATCSGTAVDSKMRLRVNFSSQNYDL